MPAYIYKIMHLTGVMLTFLSFGGLLYRSIIGSDDKKLKRFAAINNGVGLLLVLVGGFGMMARYQYEWQLWLFGKIAIWIIFAASMALINRKPEWGVVLWWVTILFGGLASYLAVMKPA